MMCRPPLSQERRLPSICLRFITAHLFVSTPADLLLGIRHCAPSLTIPRDGPTSASTSRGSSRAHNYPARPKMVRRPRSVMAGAPKITLNHSLHSTLKEFFDPLRTSDSRADFYTVYSRKSGEFDRNYAREYDDLNTFLIFVSRLVFALGTEY